MTKTNTRSRIVSILLVQTPKVYSYDLQLNLDKNGSSVGEAFICL